MFIGGFQMLRSKKISFIFFTLFSVQNVVAQPSMQELVKSVMSMDQQERDEQLIPVTQQFLDDGGNINELYSIRFWYEQENGGSLTAQDEQEYESYGHNVNKEQTLLQFAAVNGKTQFITFLLAHGANPLVLNSDGENAIEVAVNGMQMLSYMPCDGMEIKFQGQVQGFVAMIEAINQEDRKVLMQNLPVDSIPDVVYDESLTQVSYGCSNDYDILDEIVEFYLLIPLEFERLIQLYVEDLSVQDQKIFARKVQPFIAYFQERMDFVHQELEKFEEDIKNNSEKMNEKNLETFEFYKYININFARLKKYIQSLQ